MNINIEKLKKDLIEYFSTAINQFDADINDIEKINDIHPIKLIEIAKLNGFNLELYKIEELRSEDYVFIFSNSP